MRRYHEEEREAEKQEAIASSALLAAAVELHDRAHNACPFMTLNTGPKGITVEMKFKNYDDASDVHGLLLKFFSANTNRTEG